MLESISIFIFAQYTTALSSAPHPVLKHRRRHCSGFQTVSATARRPLTSESYCNKGIKRCRFSCSTDDEKFRKLAVGIFWDSVTSRRDLIGTCKETPSANLTDLFFKKLDEKNTSSEPLSDSLARSLAKLWPKFGSKGGCRGFHNAFRTKVVRSTFITI